MNYTETLDRLATATEEQVVAAFESWQDKLIDYADFLAVATAYLSAAGNRATALADTALAAFLTTATAAPVPVLGLLPPEVDHRPELATITAMTGVVVADKLTVYARATTLATAQDAYSEGITRRGIPGWTRVLNGGACELCQDLAGPVLPGDVPIYHHKGCGCTQRPVLDERKSA